MMKVDDPTAITVPGSRWPITLKKSDAARPQPLPIVSPSFKRPSPISTSSSISRRKPRITYQSPEAGTPLSVPSNSSSSRSSTSTSPTSSFSSASGCSFFTPAKPLFKLQPALPSYHPLSPGQLLLAAAARADAAARRQAATKGGSTQDNASVDDALNNKHTAGAAAMVDDDMDARRSSSRTRRPVAKLREGAEAETEDGASNAGNDGSVNGGNGKSPTGNKRRRAAAGGGSRKKKKEPSGPLTEPYPPRRERQRRGAAQAAAAALASSAEALSAALEEEAMEVDEAASVAASAVPDAGADVAQDEETKSIAGVSDHVGDLNDQTTPSTGPVRAKRQARPKRGRVTSPANASKEETSVAPPTTSTRTTRGSVKRRGSSASGSEASASTSTGSAAPIAETLAAKRNSKAKDTKKDKGKAKAKFADDVSAASIIDKNELLEDMDMDVGEQPDDCDVKEESTTPVDAGFPNSPDGTDPISTIMQAAARSESVTVAA